MSLNSINTSLEKDNAEEQPLVFEVYRPTSNQVPSEIGNMPQTQRNNPKASLNTNRLQLQQSDSQLLLKPIETSIVVTPTFKSYHQSSPPQQNVEQAELISIKNNYVTEPLVQNQNQAIISSHDCHQQPLKQKPTDEQVRVIESNPIATNNMEAASNPAKNRSYIIKLNPKTLTFDMSYQGGKKEDNHIQVPQETIPAETIPSEAVPVETIPVMADSKIPDNLKQSKPQAQKFFQQAHDYVKQAIARNAIIKAQKREKSTQKKEKQPKVKSNSKSIKRASKGTKQVAQNKQIQHSSAFTYLSNYHTIMANPSETMKVGKSEQDKKRNEIPSDSSSSEYEPEPYTNRRWLMDGVNGQLERIRREYIGAGGGNSSTRKVIPHEQGKFVQVINITQLYGNRDQQPLSSHPCLEGQQQSQRTQQPKSIELCCNLKKQPNQILQQNNSTIISGQQEVIPTQRNKQQEYQLAQHTQKQKHRRRTKQLSQFDQGQQKQKPIFNHNSINSNIIEERPAKSKDQTRRKPRRRRAKQTDSDSSEEYFTSKRQYEESKKRKRMKVMDEDLDDDDDLLHLKGPQKKNRKTRNTKQKVLNQEESHNSHQAKDDQEPSNRSDENNKSTYQNLKQKISSEQLLNNSVQKNQQSNKVIDASENQTLTQLLYKPTAKDKTRKRMKSKPAELQPISETSANNISIDGMVSRNTALGSTNKTLMGSIIQKAVLKTNKPIRKYHHWSRKHNKEVQLNNSQGSQHCSKRSINNSSEMEHQQDQQNNIISINLTPNFAVTNKNNVSLQPSKHQNIPANILISPFNNQNHLYAIDFEQREIASTTLSKQSQSKRNRQSRIESQTNRKLINQNTPKSKSKSKKHFNNRHLNKQSQQQLPENNQQSNQAKCKKKSSNYQHIARIGCNQKCQNVPQKSKNQISQYKKELSNSKSQFSQSKNQQQPRKIILHKHYHYHYYYPNAQPQNILYQHAQLVQEQEHERLGHQPFKRRITKKQVKNHKRHYNINKADFNHQNQEDQEKSGDNRHQGGKPDEGQSQQLNQDQSDVIAAHQDKVEFKRLKKTETPKTLFKVIRNVAGSRKSFRVVNQLEHMRQSISKNPQKQRV